MEIDESKSPLLTSESEEEGLENNMDLEKKSKSIKKSEIKSTCLGLSLATISGLIFTVNNIIFKANQLGHVDTILLRSVIQVFILTPWCYFNGHKFFYGWTKTQVIILIQAFACALVLVGCYQCLKYMPLGDAMSLLFSGPLFTGKLL